MNKQELFTVVAGSMPFNLGMSLRRLLYPSIFATIGQLVEIHPDVEFQGADQIHLGSHATVRRGARIRRIGINSSITIEEHALIESGVDIRTYRDSYVRIGSYSRIGPYTCISGGKVTIGHDCLIASHCSIYANNHIFTDPNQKIREQGSSIQGIEIDDDCWIGSGARIVDGVTIGKGSVIGAGAVVTKDIPPDSIAVGVPARVIGQRGNQQPDGVNEKDDDISSSILSEVQP